MFQTYRGGCNGGGGHSDCAGGGCGVAALVVMVVVVVESIKHTSLPITNKITIIKFKANP
jgi:hypothetical protein